MFSSFLHFPRIKKPQKSNSDFRIKPKRNGASTIDEVPRTIACPHKVITDDIPCPNCPSLIQFQFGKCPPFIFRDALKCFGTTRRCVSICTLTVQGFTFARNAARRSSRAPSSSAINWSTRARSLFNAHSKVGNSTYSFLNPVSVCNSLRLQDAERDFPWTLIYALTSEYTPETGLTFAPSTDATRSSPNRPT